MCNRRNMRGGFSLVEILCVVVIVGIAAAIIVPELSSRDDLKVAAAARAVMADLIYAQDRAITYQQMHYVTFDMTNQQYSLLAGPGPTVIEHPVNHVNYVVGFGPTNGGGAMRDSSLASVQFVSATISGSALAFDEMGTPMAYDPASGTTEAITSGAIVLQCGTQRLQVSIEPYTGSISVNPVP